MVTAEEVSTVMAVEVAPAVVEIVVAVAVVVVAPDAAVVEAVEAAPDALVEAVVDVVQAVAAEAAIITVMLLRSGARAVVRKRAAEAMNAGLCRLIAANAKAINPSIAAAEGRST